MRTTQRLLLSVLVLFLLVASMAAHAQTALQFVPVAPCRVADTRLRDGQFGGPPIQGGTSRDFAIPQGACNIPATAAAYSLNVTVVPEGPLWVVTVWPAGQDLPHSSIMNSPDGRVKANAAIVPAGSPNEAVSVYVSATTNVVLDINGYFVPATDSALAFYPLAPCRIQDTRKPGGGGYLQGGVPRTFDVLASSCQIPDSAHAYSLNFTVVPRSDAVWVFTAWPTGSPAPNYSTLNAPTGTVVANAALVPAGTNGEIDEMASSDTDLVVDVNGYFAAPGPGGLALYPLPATCRVLDTRLSGGPFNGVMTIDVLGSHCQPSPSAEAYVVNATVQPQGPLWLLTLWPDGHPEPNASTLNAYDGAIASNMAIVPTNNGKIDADANASLRTDLILDMASYFAPLATLTITTTSLPDGIVGQPYSQTLGASGGEPPYTWTITNGNLPPGLHLDSGTGAISGTPTAGGAFPFTVKVTDALSDTASENLNINVQIGTLVVSTMSLPMGMVTVPYNATLGASGGVPPYSWGILSGALPAGLRLNNSSGLISGTPTATGSSTFTVQVQDTELHTAQAPLQIVIDAAANNAALHGNYAFSFNAYNNGNPLFGAGSFVADGNGNITSGILDSNNGAGSTQLGYAFTGTYAVTADGLGTMTFNVTTLGVMNFHIAVLGTGNGSLIQDNADPNTRGSGAFYLQTTTDFLVPPSAGYAIGTLGADGSLSRYAKAEQMILFGGVRAYVAPTGLNISFSLLPSASALG